MILLEMMLGRKIGRKKGKYKALMFLSAQVWGVFSLQLSKRAQFDWFLY